MPRAVSALSEGQNTLHKLQVPDCFGYTLLPAQRPPADAPKANPTLLLRTAGRGVLAAITLATYAPSSNTSRGGDLGGGGGGGGNITGGARRRTLRILSSCNAMSPIQTIMDHCFRSSEKYNHISPQSLA